MSQRATPETDAPHDPEIDAMRLGADGPLVEYHETGGHCSRPDCPRPSPRVVLAGKLIELPCPAHAAEQEEEWEREERERLAARYMTESGATPRIRDWTFETYARNCNDDAGRAALATAQRWLRTYRETGARQNLILFGEVGSGKTGLAWCVIRDLCMDGIEARLVNFKALLDEMRDCIAHHQPTDHAFSVGYVPVLALDDIGAERPTEWACGELLRIVDTRYERGLPTIYISNYTPDTLAKRLGHDDPVVGERIVSRMCDGAMQHRLRSGDRRMAA